ncbi:MAG: FadR family transcriptional regulator [Acetobacteraceae bacterium]|nr:FadR family transcriptional regulator [Acetobacteraceae bacterium]
MSDSKDPVWDTAVRRIQKMVRNGELQPGQALPTQRIMSERLGVSRASLREALSVLETLGVLRTEPRRGTYLTTSARSDVGTRRWRFESHCSPAEVYQYRLVTEAYAAGLAAIRAGDEHIEDLRANVAGYKAATREGDLLAISQIDFEFHDRIMAVAGNRIFSEVHARFADMFHESQRLPLPDRERLWESVMEHENVLAAIEMHDPDGAQYFMRVHIIKAANRAGVPLSGKA